MSFTRAVDATKFILKHINNNNYLILIPDAPPSTTTYNDGNIEYMRYCAMPGDESDPMPGDESDPMPGDESDYGQDHGQDHHFYLVIENGDPKCQSARESDMITDQKYWSISQDSEPAQQPVPSSTSVDVEEEDESVNSEEAEIECNICEESRASPSQLQLPCVTACNFCDGNTEEIRESCSYCLSLHYENTKDENNYCPFICGYQCLDNITYMPNPEDGEIVAPVSSCQRWAGCV